MKDFCGFSFGIDDELVCMMMTVTMMMMVMMMMMMTVTMMMMVMMMMMMMKRRLRTIQIQQVCWSQFLLEGSMMSLHVLSHRPFLRISHQCNGGDDDGGDDDGDGGDGDGGDDGYGGGGGGDDVPQCFSFHTTPH